MNLPTNAIALLGERICTKMLPQRDKWSSAATDMGDIVTEKDTRQASGRPEAASSLQIDSHRITVIVNLDTLGVLRVG